MHDGSLSCSGYATVIYRGKEFPAPLDLMKLMARDYIIHLLETGEVLKMMLGQKEL